jgi:hypothetical protein
MNLIMDTTITNKLPLNPLQDLLVTKIRKIMEFTYFKGIIAHLQNIHLFVILEIEFPANL